MRGSSSFIWEHLDRSDQYGEDDPGDWRVSDGRGYMILTPGSSSRGWRIEDVNVAPEYRRQGVATALLREAVRQLGEIEHSADLTAIGAAWRQSVDPTFQMSGDPNAYTGGDSNYGWLG